jgi:putative transposase
VLHTWGQNLGQHLHVHCLVSAGALAPDGSWIAPRKGFLFPVKALSKVFRGKYLAALNAARVAGRVHLAGSQASLTEPAEWQRFFAHLYAHDWVVYAKRPFAGPEQVLDYLGRYTHRVAISNNRLLNLQDGWVRFRYKDYAHGNRRKTMRLDAQEFIRRFLLHILPKGLHSAFAITDSALTVPRQRNWRPPAQLSTRPRPQDAETVEQFMLRVTGIDIHRYPLCGQGRLHIVSTLAPLTRSPAPLATGPP